MKFSIVFENSGDSIPFDSVNPAVLEYYVDYLDNNNLNSFATIDGDLGRKLKQAIDHLRQSTVDINQWADKIFGKSFPVLSDEEYLNQHNLNQLHADWVNSQLLTYNIQEKRKQYLGNKIVEQVADIFPDDIPFPIIGSVISRLGLSSDYSNINHFVHLIESQYQQKLEFKIDRHPWVQVNNPFDKSVITNNIANLQIDFHHLGRTLWDKYRSFDTDLQYKDENTFDELLGFVSLHFEPPQTVPLSKEYIDWCNIHNKIPSGQYLNIGNIPNLEVHLKDYRLVVLRNLLQYNSFSINLIERH